MPISAEASLMFVLPDVEMPVGRLRLDVDLKLEPKPLNCYTGIGVCNFHLFRSGRKFSLSSIVLVGVFSDAVFCTLYDLFLVLITRLP